MELCFCCVHGTMSFVSAHEVRERMSAATNTYMVACACADENKQWLCIRAMSRAIAA